MVNFKRCEWQTTSVPAYTIDHASEVLNCARSTCGKRTELITLVPFAALQPTEDSQLLARTITAAMLGLAYAPPWHASPVDHSCGTSPLRNLCERLYQRAADVTSSGAIDVARTVSWLAMLINAFA